MIRYIYRRRCFRIAARLFDAFGGGLYWLFRVLRRSPSPALSDLPERPRIAFIRLDGIGDVLAALPAARALKARFAEGKLILVVRKDLVELLESLPFVNEVLAVDSDLYSVRTSALHSISKVCSLIKLLRAGNFDIAVEPRGDPRIILAMWASRIPLRIGVRAAGVGFLLSASRDYLRDMPEAQHNLSVAALLGLDEAWEPVQLEPDAQTWQTLLKDHPRLEEPFFVIHPGAAMQTKVWPARRFAQTANAVSSQYNLMPVIVGGADTASAAELVTASLEGDWLNLVGKTSLTQLAGLVSHARLFVGNDSGPAHLSACCGCSTVMVFGGSNEVSVWRPPGEHVEAVYHRVDCSPCEQRACASLKCLLGIAVAEVLRAVERVLNRAGQK